MIRLQSMGSRGSRFLDFLDFQYLRIEFDQSRKDGFSLFSCLPAHKRVF
jgi:hypothetical protein